MQNVLILGATSAIAEASARLFAKRQDQLYLLARNTERLERMAKDLKIRGAKEVHTAAFDASHPESIQASLDTAQKTLGRIDLVLIAHGTLPNQKACEKNLPDLLKEFEINAVSTIAALSVLANFMEIQRQGTLAVITSVAGDRGRQSNYIYGAAKGAVNIFLQGLRNRLHKSGVLVLTIKPGFVDTPMTASFKKGLLWAQPEKIAAGILKAIQQKKSEVYLPGFWRGIMFLIRSIPESIFKKMRL